MSTATENSRKTAGADLRVRAFLRRLTLATGGGFFIDGFIFASVAAALAGKAMSHDMHVTPVWAGLISSSTLIGTFFGSLIVGYITDRLGRKPMFTIDLATFVVCAALMFLVGAPWQLFILALLMGLAIGADYSIASPLLAEFTPRARRGRYLGVLEILWNVGYVVGFLAGYLINTDWPGAWHVTLAMSLAPALLCLVVRHGLPESPRWLSSKGRPEEAATIMRQKLGRTADTEDFGTEAAAPTRYRVLFSAGYLQRTMFAATFWTCLVLPYFALIFFQPTVLTAIGLGSSALAGAVLGTIIALVGVIVGWSLVDRIGRRHILIWPMFGSAVTLLVASFGDVLPVWLGAASFFGYLFSYGIMSVLAGIYPDEIFPTPVRAAGVGLAAAASRVGAAIGTFVLPVSLSALGLQWTMIFMVAVSLIGGVTGLMWAPETKGMQLTEASAPGAQLAAAPRH